ncbi:MAG: DUF1996 domain-containing protein [Solirubrobacteraceae bacterium]
MTLSLFRARGGGRTLMPAGLLVLALVFLCAAPMPARANGIFVADCAFSHRAMNDPIVSHGKPGWSHAHDFYGDSSTNAFSTFGSLRRSPGNCTPADDRSAYWTPTLYRNGMPVRAVQVQAYYEDFFRYGRVLPFPSGLRMVAGGGMGMTAPAGTVRWTCQPDNSLDGGLSIPSCPSSYVTLRVSFPDCWDGRRVDSPNHRSHMAYAQPDPRRMGIHVCPAGHPVVVPDLQLNITYPMHNGKGVTLASGSVKTAHADFFNGWKPSTLLQRINTDLNGGMACDDLLGCIRISPPKTDPVTARPRAKLDERFYPPERTMMPGPGMNGM